MALHENWRLPDKESTAGLSGVSGLICAGCGADDQA
jgi:hypothetical protein